MSEERIKTDRGSEDPTPLTPEELDMLAGGVMESFNKHSEQLEK
jgi:hypothetical protein